MRPKRIDWRARGVVLASGLLLLAACSGSGAASDNASDGGAGSDPAAGGGGGNIKFGYLIGVTGDYSAFFEPSLAGAEIAIEEINDAGGVLGRQVELVTQDNLSTVEGAVQGYSRLVDVENVDAIGGVESDGAVAIVNSVNEQQIPTMCPACGTSELDTGTGEFMFRITGSDTDLGLIAAQFARDAGFDNVAMLVQNTEGAAGPAEVFKRVFGEATGQEITTDVRFDPGRSTYQSEIQQAFQSQPDAVYMAAGHEAGIVIYREWERRGYGGQFFVSPDLGVPEIAELSPALEDGVATAAIATYVTDTPAFESYAERYEEKTGEQPLPGVYDANQYDQYIGLALAMAVAGTTDGPAVAEQVPQVLSPPGTVVYSYEEGLAELEAGNDIDFHGASTSLDLNEHNNLESPVFGEQHIQGGEWVQVNEIELDPELRELLE